MKYTMEQINQGEDELILRYKERNPEIDYIMNFMSFPEKKLIGQKFFAKRKTGGYGIV